MPKSAPKARIVEIVKRITVEWKDCLQCGKRFEGAKVAEFCSKSCANKASYQRHAEARRTHRRETYAKKRGKI